VTPPDQGPISMFMECTVMQTKGLTFTEAVYVLIYSLTNSILRS